MAEMALCNLKEIAVNAVYPVGSLYWSSNETSPADVFGFGVWVSKETTIGGFYCWERTE